MVKSRSWWLGVVVVLAGWPRDGYAMDGIDVDGLLAILCHWLWWSNAVACGTALWWLWRPQPPGFPYLGDPFFVYLAKFAIFLSVPMGFGAVIVLWPVILLWPLCVWTILVDAASRRPTEGRWLALRLLLVANLLALAGTYERVADWVHEAELREEDRYLNVPGG